METEIQQLRSKKSETDLCLIKTYATEIMTACGNLRPFQFQVSNVSGVAFWHNQGTGAIICDTAGL